MTLDEARKSIRGTLEAEKRRMERLKSRTWTPNNIAYALFVLFIASCTWYTTSEILLSLGAGRFLLAVIGAVIWTIVVLKFDRPP
jgi:hypothetical protein